MTDLSSAVFKVSCEIDMARAILQMMSERGGNETEVNGIHAAIVLLGVAAKSAEEAEALAGGEP